eukprot:9186756-Alexandrium_andersonii.AAC.1
MAPAGRPTWAQGQPSGGAERLPGPLPRTRGGISSPRSIDACLDADLRAGPASAWGSHDLLGGSALGHASAALP